ncbi:hypothetical protein DTO96_101260 [Ephemeroptericola cinctiostellae]|uniref:Lipoprotein n=1 Tax=Ephemeroptericola cinctiostellae TaxID=2268024 RepID=A0A345DAZ1_9BURK|nr:lipoprotein [Ephemeroptericola cinctiostellae]AXF85529.1 hypothetical protein DTO96_101260 [Ephemeroptericola cinctiostellae]
MRTVIRLAVLLGATAMLCTACGYKGPLYLPTTEPTISKAPVTALPSDTLKK